MTRRRTGTLCTLLAAAVLIAPAPGPLRASIEPAGRPRFEVDSGFSPLYPRRLSLSMQDMDRPETRLIAMDFELRDDPPPGVPSAVASCDYDPFTFVASANPASACIGSACTRSYCLGSLCVGSGCLGSACAGSQCLGSICTTSACGGSVCAGSACAGSVCGGSICVGTACGRGCATAPGASRGLES